MLVFGIFDFVLGFCFIVVLGYCKNWGWGDCYCISVLLFYNWQSGDFYFYVYVGSVVWNFNNEMGSIMENCFFIWIFEN